MSNHAIAAMALLVVMAVAASPALAEYGTLSKCLNGCLPGVNACTNCCNGAFKSIEGPCESHCQDSLKICNGNCTSAFERCSNSGKTNCPSICDQCTIQCANMFGSCDNTCGGLQTGFSCPDWVDPDQHCQYDCQVWNPASRSCAGAPMNGCQ